jgi:hypothetical protein
MRLINVESLALEEFMGGGAEVPSYAILSHTWADNEVTFQDFTNAENGIRASKKGFDKISKACALARNDGLNYAWVDTCCIDKTSSAELTEAINSMFRWYQDAATCYVWLADLPTSTKPNALPDVDSLSKCRWFTRGWTLQELIAPRIVKFYDQSWTLCGSKESLGSALAKITNIDTAVLDEPDLLSTLSIAKRMSWAATRQTTRVEDMAYCLLGIFDVNMPMLYGEGSRAFVRLQEEIIKGSNDLSIFAWRASSSNNTYTGVFASSPTDFGHSSSVQLLSDAVFNPEFTLTNKGVRMQTSVYSGEKDGYIINLNCDLATATGRQPIGIFVKLHGGGIYYRAKPTEFGIQERAAVSKPREVFLFKQISPARLQQLQGSHRNAFQLRQGFNSADALNYPGFPFQANFIVPQDQWDSQRRMFLTQGSANFSAYIYFGERLGSKAQTMGSFMLAFGKEAGVKDPWVTILTPYENQKPFLHLTDPTTTMAEIRRLHPSRVVHMTDGVNKQTSAKLSVSLSRVSVDGQEVYCIDLHYTEGRNDDMSWDKKFPTRQGRRLSS